MEPIKYTIKFHIFKTNNLLQVKEKTITYSNEKYNSVDELNMNQNYSLTAHINVNAQNFNTFSANIQLYNIPYQDSIYLTRTSDECFSVPDGKKIEIDIVVSGVSIFYGVVYSSILENTTTGNILNIQAIPMIRTYEKSLQVDISKFFSTEKSVKQYIASKLGLILKSNTESDKRPLKNDIHLFIERPIVWLKQRYPNESIQLYDNVLSFFDLTKKTSTTIGYNKVFLNENTGLLFIRKVSAVVYQCSCLFNPYLNLRTLVTISPKTTINKTILNGKINGFIMNVQHDIVISNSVTNSNSTIINVIATS